jgi:hypothetical protein
MLQQAMDSGHTFRSVIAHSICASIQGDAAAYLDRMSHTRVSLCMLKCCPFQSQHLSSRSSISNPHRPTSPHSFTGHFGCVSPEALSGGGGIAKRIGPDQVPHPHPHPHILRIAFSNRPPPSPALQLYIWPLTSFLWAFDINGVAQRSLACEWIRSCTSHDEAELVIRQKRGEGGVAVRSREVLPQWSDYEFKIVFCDAHTADAATAAAAAAAADADAGVASGSEESSSRGAQKRGSCPLQ